MRASLTDVSVRGEVNEEGILFFDGLEVALVYFRAGYTPDDYPGEAEWRARRCIGEMMS